MTNFIYALALFASAPLLETPVVEKTSICTCFVRKIVNNEEVGPKFVIGWRFRESDRGAVTYPAVDIHDPGNLLGGRSISTILDGAEMRMFLIKGDSGRNLPPIALAYSHSAISKTEKTELFSGGIMANASGRVSSVYFGNCTVKDYGKNSEEIFSTLKSWGANEFQ